MTRIHALLLALTLSGAALADIDPRSADADMYPADVSYAAAIPTPTSILGHELGAEPVRHHKLVEYLTTVAGLSDRIALEVIGYSHERRPILFLVVTSPDNHARLDEIRERHSALSDADANATIDDSMPVVTWLNYGVHGAESSGMDAVVPFVYYLAAAESAELDRILDDSVILITAIFNPDGHSKRVAWFDAYGGERDIADPAHIEHNYSWQMARTNHYWFDLNRQWLLLTQPEPQAWMRKWHEWRPNITVDYHEMGSGQTYYFHPGVATRTNPLVPEAAERLLAETVRTSEDFLDGEARLYFHGERFDNYYVGKGSTFPLVNGGVGILYEAAAALGREIETANGLRTYRENIRKHFRTSIASIEAGLALRRDYLEYQREFYRSALQEASRANTKAWIVSADGDAFRLERFAALLSAHRIQSYRPTRDVTVGDTLFRAGESLLVPVTQPQYRLIRSIFETNREFEDTTFYDVSTWTLPPAFGLAHAPLSGRAWRGDLAGSEFAPAGTIAPPPRASYAYAFEWNQYFAPRALQRALENGLLARVATQPFTAITVNGERAFARGSIVIPFDRQTVERDAIHALMQEIAASDGISVHALTSGRSAIGTAGVDIGGPAFRPLKAPQTLLVVGDGINLYDAGEIWHLLDFRMHTPVTLRPRDTLGGIDWNRYTHIVFPSGNYDGYAPEFAARLRTWVAEGGTLIGFREAAPWVRATTLDWVEPDPAAAAVNGAEEAAADEEEEPQPRTDYAEKERIEALDIIGGAIFSADLDVTHPLGFGFPRRGIWLHKNVEEPMTATENPYATVIAYDEQPVYSGYVSDDNAEALAKTPALIAERSGRGSVILFADNPNFRGYWYGTNKLFLNALYFSRAFDPPAEN